MLQYVVVLALGFAVSFRCNVWGLAFFTVIVWLGVFMWKLSSTGASLLSAFLDATLTAVVFEIGYMVGIVLDFLVEFPPTGNIGNKTEID